jgi:type IV secretion system protein VirB9
MPTVAVNRLNFDYRIKVVKGKPSFKPLRAMDDGYHTYISMNEDLPQGEAPALVGISRSGEEQMINYRMKGNIYVVDGTVSKLALISGVGGEQQRIELTRQACQRRGWLGICWDPKE